MPIPEFFDLEKNCWFFSTEKNRSVLIFYMKTQLALLPLKKVPQYYNEVVQIIEKELGYTPANHFSDDFLPLMEANNWENCYVIFKDQEVIGHIGIKPTTFSFNEIELRFALIGGICLKEKHQGKGYFKEVFPQILNERKNEFALFLLWTGEAQGYQKFGFYEIGRMIQTGEYNFDNSLRFFARKLNLLSSEEKEYIKTSYQHSFRNHFKPQRSAHDWEVFFRMPSVDVYFKRRSDKFLSYFMINKGQDLTQIIHEIGSHDHNEFIQLCHDLNKFKTWLPDNMGHESSQSTFLFLGVFKLGNYDHLSLVGKKLGLALPPFRPDNEKEILESFLNSEKVNFYIPGINSI